MIEGDKKKSKEKKFEIKNQRKHISRITKIPNEKNKNFKLEKDLYDSLV